MQGKDSTEENRRMPENYHLQDDASRKKKRERIFTVLFLFCSFCALMIFAFYVNRHIHIKALYMDDLYLFSFFREQDFFTFSFPIGNAVRFRPVYWAISYIEMVFVGNDPNRYWYFNVALNGLLACFLCYFSWVVSKGKKIVSFSLGIIFLSAHFAYYQIAQALGILETLALGFSLITLYFLYLQLNEERHFVRNLVLSHLFFFLLVFTHERYIALLPLFYVPLLFRGRVGKNTAVKATSTGGNNAETEYKGTEQEKSETRGNEAGKEKRKRGKISFLLRAFFFFFLLPKLIFFMLSVSLPLALSFLRGREARKLRKALNLPMPSKMPSRKSTISSASRKGRNI